MLYQDLIEQGINNVNIIAIGKGEYSNDNSNWTNTNILPVVVDQSPNEIWYKWGASQRRLFFLDINGEYVTDFNISTWDYNTIYNTIMELIGSGCADAYACNYHPEAMYNAGCYYAADNYDCNGNCIAGVDCNGECGGSLLFTGVGDGTEAHPAGKGWDVCGSCGGNMTDEADCACSDGLVRDCNGACGGSLLNSCIGSVGNEDNQSTCEAAGGYWSQLGYDECGVCGGQGAPANYNCELECIVDIDCNGICGGTADPAFECQNGTKECTAIDCQDLGSIKQVLPEYSIVSIYPNPFNPVATIHYTLPEYAYINLLVYDIKGRQVESLLNGFQTAGYHTIKWNASYFPSGVYFVQLTTSTFSQIHKLALVK